MLRVLGGFIQWGWVGSFPPKETEKGKGDRERKIVRWPRRTNCCGNRPKAAIGRQRAAAAQPRPPICLKIDSLTYDCMVNSTIIPHACARGQFVGLSLLSSAASTPVSLHAKFLTHAHSQFTIMKATGKLTKALANEQFCFCMW